jgi:ethanolamine ammonia-lyase small subunit
VPTGLPPGPFELAIVIADGLSARAVAAHAAPLLQACLPRLEGWRIAPIVLATQARVALGDAVGARLQAACVAVLIGERPGLSVADSLGVYITWEPRPGRRDAERMMVWLLGEARRRKLTGTGLKLDMAALAAPNGKQPT